MFLQMPGFNDLNIDTITIDGDISILSEAVSEIDLLLQNLSNETEEMKSTLLRYSGSNQGNQYLKCAAAALNLSACLYEAAESLNLLQRKVVEYCEMVIAYDELNITISPPHSFYVEPINVEINTGTIRFDLTEMIIVHDSLEAYSQNVRDGFRILSSHVDDIGTVWHDPQYDDFVDCIEDVSSAVLPKCAQVEEYKDYLHNIITHITTS